MIGYGSTLRLKNRGKERYPFSRGSLYVSRQATRDGRLSVTEQQRFRNSGQGGVAARRRADQCRCVVGDHGQ